MKKSHKQKKPTLQQRFQRLNKELKAFITISVFVFIAIVAGIFFLNSNSLLQADQSSAQVAFGRCKSDKPELVCWNGKPWFLVGANLAWLDWSCDFGTGCSWASTLNSASKQQRLRQDLTAMKNAKINTVRWWVFQDAPGGREWGR